MNDLAKFASNLQDLLDWQEQARDLMKASYFHHKARAGDSGPGSRWHKKMASDYYDFLFPQIPEYKPNKLK